MEFIQHIGGLSYLGVFGISLVAMIVLPFPEEVTLLSFGYLAGIGVFHLPILIPVCMAGLFIADFFIYQLARHGSKIVTGFYEKTFASKFQFLNNLSGAQLDRVIIFSRFLIYFRFLSPFLAGYHHYSFKKFLANEIISLSVYTTLFIMLGYFLRNQLERVISGVGVVQNIIFAIIILMIAITIFRSLKKYVIQYLGEGKV